MTTIILRNAARCKKCGDIIESRYRHDFVECKCGAIFVDGGHDYLRCGGNLEDFESLSEVKDLEEVRSAKILPEKIETVEVSTPVKKKKTNTYINNKLKARRKRRVSI